MRFKIKVQGLVGGVTPAIGVATKGVVKEYPGEGLVALHPTPDRLEVLADGGRISVRSFVPYMISVCTEYAFQEEGTVVVNATDLQRVLESFKPDDVLEVHAGGADGASEVIFRLASDPDQMQTMPCSQHPLSVPGPSGKPNHEISIRRIVFNRALPRVLYAGGEEERRPRFLYWVMRAKKNFVRMAASSGARLVSLDMKGEGMGVQGQADLFIPVEPSKVVQKLLKDATGDQLKISSYDSGQFAFECDNLCIIVAGFEAMTDWVNEDKFLERENTNVGVVSLEDWKLAALGTYATNNNEEQEKSKRQQKVHTTNVSFHAENGILQLNAGGSMRSLRKAKMTDHHVTPGSPSECAVQCASELLNDVAKYADGSAYIQIEMAGPDKPIGFRCYAGEKVTHGPLPRTGLEGIDEEYSVYIARLSESR